MLVQLSPWQTATTSIAAAAGKRRKSIKNGEKPAPPTVVASFVTTSKRSSKKKSESTGFHSKEDMVATLAITSAHRVSIVGRNTSASVENKEQETPMFQESKHWQYASRPGKSSSFFQGPLVNGKATPQTPAIPAIMDARNDRLYALQNANETMSSWHATQASGPDDNESSSAVAKVSLSKPALSLTLFPYKKGIVCGTCADGTLFIARWVYSKKDRKENLQVSNIGKSCAKGDQHVFTTVMKTTGTSKQSGEKRKASEEQDLTIAVHQIFSCGAGQIKVCRHELALRPSDGDWEIIKERMTILNLPNATAGDSKGSLMNTTSISASQMDDSTLALVYRFQSSCYCANISLETGRFTRAPFPLPPSTKYVEGLTPSIFAVGTKDEILFFDIEYGAVVHSVPLTEVIQKDSEEWKMTTDSKRGRLAVLSYSNTHIQVSMANASLDGTVHRLPTKKSGYNLATGLRSFLATTQVKGVVDEGCLVVRNLMDVESSTVVKGEGNEEISSYKENLDKVVERSLDRLQTCQDQILDIKNEYIEADLFLKEYESAIINIFSAMEFGNKLNKTKKGAMNGFHSASPKGAIPPTPKLLNGTKEHSPFGPTEQMKATRAYTPSSIPQQFIDGAMSIVLSTLQLPRVDNQVVGQRVQFARLDARLILSRLVQSGKVSARLHFEPDDQAQDKFFFSVLRSIKLTNKRGKRVFSPVDMIHEVISCCSDVSERLMVTMIHYLFCRSLPEDIAENLVDSLSAHHPDKILSKEFFTVSARLQKITSEAKANGTSLTESETHEAEAKLEAISYQVLKAGASFLLKGMVQYSRCNETLLRGAIRDGFPLAHEVELLLYILADLLKSTSIDAISSGEQRSWSLQTKSITQWISALCDAKKGKLQAIEAEGDDESAEKSSTEYVRRAIDASLEQTEAVMALRDAYEHANASLRGDAKKIQDSSSAVKKELGPVPPYCIERLVF